MNTKKLLVMALALTTATCVFARGHHYHHHHSGLGLAAGIVGLTAATVALAHDIVAPRSRGGPPADGRGTCPYGRRPADGRGTCSYSRRAPTCRRCAPASGLSGSGCLSAPLPPSVSLSPLVMALM